MEEAINALRQILPEMNVPAERTKIRDDADLHWLGRNVGISNHQHPRMDEVRGLLRQAGARMVI
jgi:hypothetical protein